MHFSLNGSFTDSMSVEQLKAPVTTTVLGDLRHMSHMNENVLRISVNIFTKAKAFYLPMCIFCS